MAPRPPRVPPTRPALPALLCLTIAAAPAAAQAPGAAVASAAPAAAPALPADAERRLAHGRALARAGQHAEAVAALDALAADPAAPPAVAREAGLAAAQATAWSGAHPAALRRWAALRARHPRDAELALGEAQTLAWAGRHDEAERAYDLVRAAAEADGDAAAAREAAHGVARTAAWRGDLARSERLWRAAAARAGDDAGAWAGLAQALRWAGRPRAADAALERALRLAPHDADALAQRARLRAELRPAVEPRVVREGDSEGNRATTVAATVALPPIGEGRLAVTLARRELAQAGTAATTQALRAALALPLGDRLRLRADAGAVAVDAAGGARTTAGAAAASLAVRVAPGATLSLGGATAPADETAALARARVRTSGVEAGVEAALPARLSLAATAGHARLTGAPTPNARRDGSAALRWDATPALRLTASARALGWARSVREGYFAPERFAVSELAARLARGGEGGWGLVAEAGAGVQTIVLPASRATRGAQRASVTLAWRPTPAAALTLTAALSNVAAGAAPTRAEGAGYRAGSVGIGGPVGF